MANTCECLLQIASTLHLYCDIMKYMAVEAKITPLPLPEPNIKRIIPRPEDILTSQEAHLLQQADQEKRPCPCCRQPLMGEKIISEEYEGIILFCPNENVCGYREY